MTAMRYLIVIVAVSVLLPGCGPTDASSNDAAKGATTRAPTLTIDGSVLTTNKEFVLGRPVNCEEMPGDFAQLKTGAQLTLKNAADEVVGGADLEPVANMNAAGTICMWDVKFTDVPAGGRSYSIEISKWKSDQKPEAEVGQGSRSIVINAK